MKESEDIFKPRIKSFEAELDEQNNHNVREMRRIEKFYEIGKAKC